MKELAHRCVGAIFNVKVIVAICGVVLSVASHEVFHIIMHWGEIESIHLLPDTQAIIEVIFTPSAGYDIPLEEALAYTVTMVTLLLTAMLIGDIDDARSQQTVEQTILAKDFDSSKHEIGTVKAFEHLATLLGIDPTTHTSNVARK